MGVVGDLVAPDRRSDRVALHQPGRTPATVDYDRLCVQSWKVAHLLRHRGARAEAVVRVADDPSRGALLAFLGAALLGTTVRFGEPAQWNQFADPPSVIVGPTTDLPSSARDAIPARIGYGTPPSDPAVAHLERAAWSENPTPPPETIPPETPMLVAGPDGRRIDHETAMAAARRAVDHHDLVGDYTLAIRSSLTDPGTVVAGIIAPLMAGATVGILDGSTTGDVAVARAGTDVPEPRVVHPSDVV